jgi:putative DNA primase/helicase
MPMFTKPVKKDKNFISKITAPDALLYWVKLIVDAYKRLYQNEEFTESEIVSKFNEEYHRENNNCIEFLEDFEPEHFIYKQKKEVYEEYAIWAENNCLTIHGKKLLTETMRKVHGLVIQRTTKNKRTIYWYQLEAESN